jgi:hypothetical protein
MQRMGSDVVARHHVTLFMKPECHLCETARGWLEAFAADPDRFFPFDLDEIDVRLDPDTFATYRYRIPVIQIDGAVVAEGRMESEAWAALRDALARP